MRDIDGDGEAAMGTTRMNVQRGDSSGLVAGPYLVDPRSDGVTVVWEVEGGTWSVDVWPQGRRTTDPWMRFPARVIEEVIEGVTCLLCVARVDGLASGTLHEYRVVHDGSVVSGGSFATLKDASDRTRLFLLSDSHMFTTHDRIEERISAFNPDFVVNAGDIPAGTGFQKEQYTEGWFNKIGTTLARVPFLYAPGNHDDGPYFDFYFSEQSRAHPHDPSGRSFSVDHAGLHLVVVDSNSWGLSEMNAKNSGLPVPESIKARIEETLTWLRDDLSSRAARRAQWRVVVLHHPYTDEFTNRHVVPIVEGGGVDVMLGAHVHSYVKAVSLDPAKEGRPLYLTLPSAQQPETGYTTGEPDKRLMSDFPEVVATGNGNYATLEVDAEQLVVQVFGFRGDSHRPEVIDRQVLGRTLDRPVLNEVSIVPDLEDARTPGVMVRCRAVNTSGQGAVVVVPVRDNGDVTSHILTGTDPEQTRVVYLDPGEQALCEVRHELMGAGRHVLKVGEVTARVEVPEATGMEVALTGATLDRKRSEVLLPLELTNAAGAASSVMLSVLQDGTPVVVRPIEIGPREVHSTLLTVPHPGWGSHRYRALVTESVPVVDPAGPDAQVDASDEVMVAVDDSLVLTPIVMDMSGCGNHGILRGHPFVGRRSDGTTYIRFGHQGDYIEVPPSPTLVLPDGYVASIHTRIERLAEPGEMAHNPLMVRGKGVGWGATYFMRMVIDRTGTMKWGTCHGATEYGWAGGQARVGQWGDYVLSFDRLEGGVSTIDGVVVGEVPGIDATETLNGYDDQPLYIGYSRIGHVIDEIGVPKYVTQLWGDVDDVRLAGHRGVSGRRGRSGLPEEDLRLHLDFSELLMSGVHTTAWRRPRRIRAAYMRDFDRWAPVAVKAQADVPSGTGVSVVVETSDDAEHVLSSIEVPLGDGERTERLDGLRGAQYARLRVVMNGEIIDGELRVPRVHRLDLLCAERGLSSTLTWQTDADWREGSFEGAVGIEPPDRLRVYEEYTDVIHG